MQDNEIIKQRLLAFREYLHAIKKLLDEKLTKLNSPENIRLGQNNIHSISEINRDVSQIIALIVKSDNWVDRIKPDSSLQNLIFDNSKQYNKLFEELIYVLYAKFRLTLPDAFSHLQPEIADIESGKFIPQSLDLLKTYERVTEQNKNNVAVNAVPENDKKTSLANSSPKATAPQSLPKKSENSESVDSKLDPVTNKEQVTPVAELKAAAPVTNQQLSPAESESDKLQTTASKTGIVDMSKSEIANAMVSENAPVVRTPATAPQEVSKNKFPQFEAKPLAITIQYKLREPALNSATSSKEEIDAITTLRKLLLTRRLAMGETGKPYSQQIHCDIIEIIFDNVSGSDGFTGLGLGVTMLPNNLLQITGTPEQGFDGDLQLRLQNSQYPERIQAINLPLYIKFDPRTLWKDLPVQDDEGYLKANSVSDAAIIRADHTLLLAASTRGRSHAHSGTARDDHYSFLIDQPEQGWRIFAVADGAGSAKYSRRGSELACECAREWFIENNQAMQTISQRQDYLDIFHHWYKTYVSYKGEIPAEKNLEFATKTQLPGFFYRVIYKAAEMINNEAKSRQMKLKDYHTTLLLVAMYKFDFGIFFASYWVGDGAVCLYNPVLANKRIETPLLLGFPDSGEFAGQTRFLTQTNELTETAVYNRLRFTFCDNFQALIMMTDGITDPFFPAESDLRSTEKWQHFWNKTLISGDDTNPGCPDLFKPGIPPEQQAAELLQWLNFWSKGNHDDRTILLVAPFTNISKCERR